MSCTKEDTETCFFVNLLRIILVTLDTSQLDISPVNEDRSALLLNTTNRKIKLYLNAKSKGKKKR